MGLSLKDTIAKTFTNEVVQQLATHVGESDRKVERGVKAAVPAILKGLSATAETDEGLHLLQTELEKADPDASGNFARRFDETPNILVEKGRSLVKSLLGADQVKVTSGRVASAAGIGNVSAEMLTGAVAPVVTGALAKHQQSAGLSAAGLRSCLASQLKQTAVDGPIGGPPFPAGSEPVRESGGWTSLLFPLLALFGLIVLGISLFRGDDKSNDGKSADKTEIASSNLNAEGNGKGHNQKVASGDVSAANGKSGEHTNENQNTGAGGDHVGGASSLAAKDGGHDNSGSDAVKSKKDADVHAGGHDTHVGSDAESKKLPQDSDVDAHVAGGNGAEKQGSESHGNAPNSAKKNAGNAADAANALASGGHSAEKVAEKKVDAHAVGKGGEQSKVAGKHSAKNGGAAEEAEKGHGEHDGHADDHSHTDAESVTVALPAAVSSATRILNAVDSVESARAAVPELNKVTDHMAKLRGDQDVWPDTIQSLVRRRMFALMPALDEAVEKMSVEDGYLKTLCKPVDKFMGEVDRLVPER